MNELLPGIEVVDFLDYTAGIFKWVYVKNSNVVTLSDVVGTGCIVSINV